MRRFLLGFFAVFTGFSGFSQINLIVNELSQGTNASKEFIELLVVGTRTCTDSTADLRNWIFDDHNGWYGGSGTGIAAGHYRFRDIPEWQAVPYGSIIVIYNDGDRNLKIPAGSDDPTDANDDYVYILPITSSLLEQNLNEPISPSVPTYVYPTTGYVNTVDWVSMGLANGGDAVVTVNPNNLAAANHSVVFGFTPATGAQVPSVSKGAVGSGANLYLSNDLYNDAASWTIGVAGSADETPGEGNSALNTAWINSMRIQSNAFTVTTSLVQPTCAAPSGEATVTSPNGAGYTYSLDGATFQDSPTFTGLLPGDYTITVREAGGCESTAQVTINSAPGAPPVPTFTVTHPPCNTAFGQLEILSPTGAGYTYSIDGVTFQPGSSFTSLAPGPYTVTVRNSEGCESSAPFTVNAPPPSPVDPTFDVVQPTCSNPAGSITVTSPLGAGFSYSIDAINFQTGVTFPGLAPGDYTITVDNGAGCINSGIVTINAVPAQPAVPTVTSPVNYCVGETPSVLTATGTGLTWYTTSTGGPGSPTAPTPSTTTPGNTSYFVSQTVAGCESLRSEIMVTVVDFSLPAITGDNSICTAGNSTTTLANTVTGGTWSSLDQSIATVDGAGVVTGVAEGSTTIIYSASNGSCTAETTFDVTVNAFELFLSGPANPVSAGSLVDLTTSSTAPYTISEWLPASLFTSQTLTSQSLPFTQTTEVSVIGSDAAGCIDTARITVAVIPADEDVFVPGAFTPNNDGLNDLFLAYGNAIQSLEMWIFNQWGELIFRSADKGWDGRHNGTTQPSGVYIYVLKATMQSGKIINRKGAVNLVR